ncbi:MAG: hypothetical protein ACF8XB_01825 [Planctomycetota bacterium JB042]
MPRLLSKLIVLAVGSSTASALAGDCDLWSVVPSPNPAGVEDVFLRDVVAISSDDVWAVGDWRDTGFNNYTFAMHWDGAAWTIVPTPSPPPYAGGKPYCQLLAVDALGPNDVWAAGTQKIPGANGFIGPQTLVLHWNGATWSEVPSPLTPPGTSGALIRDVLAFASDEIWFVGADTVPLYSPALAMRWTGSGFVKTTPPQVNTDGQNLNAIAALSKNDVWAVGGSKAGGSTIERYLCHWDGSSWTHVPSPKPGLKHEFFDVAAIAPNDVWASGEQVRNDGSYAHLLMHWDGSAWSGHVPTSGGTRSLLAFGPNDVYGGGGGGVHHYDGATWSPCEDFPTVQWPVVWKMARTPEGGIWAVGYQGGTTARTFVARMEPKAAGCVGSGGFTPKLSLSGVPVAGQQLGVSVSDGLGGAAAVFFFGAGLASVPMNGGCSLRVAPLFPASFSVPLGGSGPGNGSLTLSAVLPPSLAGTSFGMQVFVADGGAPAGFSNTNAVQLNP